MRQAAQVFLCILILGTAAIFFTSPQNHPPEPEPPPVTAAVPEESASDSTSLPQIEGGVAAGDGGSPPARELETVEPWLSAHFRRSEFQCDCNGDCDGYPVEMDEAFVAKLQHLRDLAGAPIIITSGVRCTLRNAEVGGVPYSYHLRGLAADLYCPAVPIGDLTAQARACGLNVITYYHHGYIHVELVN